MKILQRIQNHRFSVEDALDEFIVIRDELLHSKQISTKSSDYINAFIELSNVFIKSVSEKIQDFPSGINGDWMYDVIFDGFALHLILLQYRAKEIIGTEGVKSHALEMISYFDLFRVETELLTLEEFALKNEIKPAYAIQLIRRGKIRTAQKVGNNWMIPRLTDISYKGYLPADYRVVSDIKTLIDIYPFLAGADLISISQNDRDKKIFMVQCYVSSNILCSSVIYPAKEKEIFELSLISHPGIKYIPSEVETFFSEDLNFYFDKKGYIYG